MAALFSATYPDRVEQLVLAAAAVAPSELQPLWSPRTREGIATGWGQGALMEEFLPNHADDQRVRAAWARTQRLSATRGMALKYWDLMGSINVLDVLPTIAVPTLVVARTDDILVPIETQREIVETIPGAQLAELPGNDHLLWLGDWESVVDAIEEFVTGEHHWHERGRVLSTVLFTDIVGSTGRASELGDRRWRDLLDEHERIARQQLERYDGRLVKTMGDGALATFDGPARAIHSACAIRDAMPELGIQIRAGLHTGECELMGDDIGGVAVHIAARVSAQARPGEVLVSRTVKDLIAGSGVRLADRGAHSLKGVPDDWNLYAVVADDASVTSL
jgi:class 3 adenylate cyclase